MIDVRTFFDAKSKMCKCMCVFSTVRLDVRCLSVQFNVIFVFVLQSKILQIGKDR